MKSMKIKNKRKRPLKKCALRVFWKNRVEQETRDKYSCREQDGSCNLEAEITIEISKELFIIYNF